MSCSQCSMRLVFFFKQKTAYEMRISDWSSDVCSSDLPPREAHAVKRHILDPRAIGPRGRDDMAQRQIGIEVDRAVDARMSLARDDDERLGAQIVAAQPLVGGPRDVEREVEVDVREYRHELAEAAGVAGGCDGWGPGAD